jgi:hypothetical protein
MQSFERDASHDTRNTQDDVPYMVMKEPIAQVIFILWYRTFVELYKL